MRFRIKIITYKTGRKVYIPQVKVFMGWAGIGYKGDILHFYESELDTREEALERIDICYNGNAKKTFVEFEYITK